ncbi:MAG TPA: VOC family protein [Solirubrobacteraceae bacterium]|jgi:catechol 2,3-dioxygenase-like lactoylglutathione lyase family enzyme|nr:VOC family protein [Solirubrobacteraceae bacterium]
MELTLQTALLNVTDLQQSIDFYREVLELRLASQRDQVAALIIDEKDRSQVLTLRELGRSPLRPGRGNVGVRLLSFEVGSLGDLDVIEQRLVRRDALVWRRRTKAFTAIMGLDPDRIEIAISASNVPGSPILNEDWDEIDDTIYAIE